MLPSSKQKYHEGWEKVHQDQGSFVSRMRVPNGWLYKTCELAPVSDANNDVKMQDWKININFVPK